MKLKTKKYKQRNAIKGLDCMQCPECGAPMPLHLDKCYAKDCDYEEEDEDEDGEEDE